MNKRINVFNLISLLLILSCGNKITAQNVGINATGAAPNASAMLDVASTNKGVLIPRLALTGTNDIVTIPSPAIGLLIYNTTSTAAGPTAVFANTFYYFDGTKWVAIAGNGSNNWALLGNIGTVPGTNFLGTTDNVDLDIRTNNTLKTKITTKGQIEIYNTGQSVFVGQLAGTNDNLATNKNTFVGYNSGNANTSGTENNAFGHSSLAANTTGTRNTAFGIGALQTNSTGSRNIALGYNSLFANTTGAANHAIGYSALRTNNIGNINTAIGDSALFNNTTGSYNIAMGNQSLFAATTANRSIAIGNQALKAVTTGNENIGIGNSIMSSVTIGAYNIAIGGHQGIAVGTGDGITTGIDNIVMGRGSMSSGNGNNNTAIGASCFSNLGGSNNVAMGINCLNGIGSSSENIAIGRLAMSNISASSNNNIALGTFAMQNFSGGSRNIAFGEEAMLFGGGSNNIAFGWEALTNVQGNDNIAMGQQALFSGGGADDIALGANSMAGVFTGSNNVGIGRMTITNNDGNNNTALGYNSFTFSPSFLPINNSTAIGANAQVNASNNMVFGSNAVIGWGFGVFPGAVAIRVGTNATNGNGATCTLAGIWTNASDSTKKHQIKNISYGLKEILLLHPVSYKMKKTNYQDIGFLAQEVKQVIPEIVYGQEGDMSLSYGQITPVLTKAIQELNALLEQQKKEIELLKEQMKSLKK